MKNITLSILGLLAIGLVVPAHSAQAFLWFGDDTAEEPVAEEQSVFMQATLVANNLLTVAVATTDTIAWNVKTVFEKRAEFQKKFEVDGEATFHEDSFFNKLAKAKTLKVTGDTTIGNATEDNVTIDGKIKRTLGKVYIKDGLRVTGEFQLDTATITSDNIENETILSKDIKDGKLQGKDFKDATVTDDKLAESYLVYDQIIVVTHDGTDTTSGTTLINTLGGITDEGASKRYLLKVGPGTFDLGTATLEMAEYIDIQGSGEGITTITSDTDGTDSTGIINAASNTTLRDLTVAGDPSNSNLVGIYVMDTDISISNVTIDLSTATNVLYGVRMSTGSPTLSHVIINIDASSGSASYGVQCSDTCSPEILDSNITGDGGSTSNYGIEIVSGTLSLRDSQITGTGGGTSKAINAGSPTITITNSLLDGTGGSITSHGISGGTIVSFHSNFFGDDAAVSNGVTFNAGTSQLDGGITGAGTFTCVNSYDANYAAINASCL